MYGIVHPREQYESTRPMRVSPLHERTKALGAVYFETARWERPQWYASNEALLDKYAGRLMERPAEWGVALVVAGHQTPSTSRCARRRPWWTCRRSRSST